MVEIDLDGAAEAGIIGEDQAIALRRYMAAQAGVSAPSLEKFQLTSGLADVTRAIGVALMLGLLPFIIMTDIDRRPNQGDPLTNVILPYLGATSLLLATVGLTLFFVRRQRARIVFFPATTAAAMVGGVLAVCAAVMLPVMMFDILDGVRPQPQVTWAELPILGLFLTIYWRITRFPPVPAVGLMLASLCLSGLTKDATWHSAEFSDVPGNLLAMLMGLLALLGAIWLDMTDIRRETRRSQTAFWLHVAAGTLISRGSFALAGDTDWTQWNFFYGSVDLGTFGAVGLLLLASLVLSLTLDRRSLWLAVALPFGAVAGAIGLFVVGALLLTASFKWTIWRTNLLGLLPAAIVAQVPRIELAPAGQRPSRLHLPLTPRRLEPHSRR